MGGRPGPVNGGTGFGASVVALLRGQHVQMEGGDVLDIEVGLFLGFPEIDDLDVSLAFIAHIDTVALVFLHGEIGQGLLLLVAAEGAFDPQKRPFDAALIAEELAPSLFLLDLSDLGLLAADGAISLRPLGLEDGLPVFCRYPLEGGTEAFFQEKVNQIEGFFFIVLFFLLHFPGFSVEGAQDKLPEILFAVSNFSCQFLGFPRGPFFGDVEEIEKIVPGLREIIVALRHVDQGQPPFDLGRDEPFVHGKDIRRKPAPVFLPEDEDLFQDGEEFLVMGILVLVKLNGFQGILEHFGHAIVSPFGE